MIDSIPEFHSDGLRDLDVSKDGKLVAICSAGPRQEKELQPIADYWEVLPQGTFKQAGTNEADGLDLRG